MIQLSKTGILILILLEASSAMAQESSQSDHSRPSESSMFGNDHPTPFATPSESAKKPSTEERSQEPPAAYVEKRNDTQELNSSNTGRDAFASGEVTDNALQLGGLYYQRMIMSAQQSQGVKNAPLSLPLQFDAFMDARPSDRVRGFVDGRLYYDPSLDQYSNSTSGSGFGGLQYLSNSTGPSSPSTLTNPIPIPNNPQVALDQAWLKFDINRTVFVTAGKQHVKWGTSRFWNPTDFLSTQKRNPLLPYDLRLGNSMVKFEIRGKPKEPTFMQLHF